MRRKAATTPTAGDGSPSRPTRTTLRLPRKALTDRTAWSYRVEGDGLAGWEHQLYSSFSALALRLLVDERGGVRKELALPMGVEAVVRQELDRLKVDAVDLSITGDTVNDGPQAVAVTRALGRLAAGEQLPVVVSDAGPFEVAVHVADGGAVLRRLPKAVLPIILRCQTTAAVLLERVRVDVKRTSGRVIDDELRADLRALPETICQELGEAARQGLGEAARAWVKQIPRFSITINADDECCIAATDVVDGIRDVVQQSVGRVVPGAVDYSPRTSTRNGVTVELSPGGMVGEQGWVQYVRERQERLAAAGPLPPDYRPDVLGQVERAVLANLPPLVAQLQLYLSGLAGKAVPAGNDEKNLFAARIAHLLNVLSCKIECPKCAEKSTIRFMVRKGYQTGQFYFTHTSGGAHTFSSKFFPTMNVVPDNLVDRELPDKVDRQPGGPPGRQ